MGAHEEAMAMAASETAPGITDSVVLVAFSLTLMAGLCTGIGGLLVASAPARSANALGAMLAFASGVMLFISFADLLHEAYFTLSYWEANWWFFGGAAFFALVLWAVPEVDLVDVRAGPGGGRGRD